MEDHMMVLVNVTLLKIVLFGWFKVACVYCSIDKSFTSPILSVKGVCIKLYTTCKSKTVANCVLVGLAFMIVTQLCDLCHEIPLFDRALVENHLTVSSMYH